MAGKRAQRLRRKKVTERDVAVSKSPLANAVVSKIMTYNVAHVTADPEIQLLNRLGGLFTSSLSLNENIEAMLRATSQMMQFDAATVFLLNEGSRELSACATYPHQDMVPHIAHFVLGEGILGYAVEQLETLNIGDATHDPRFKILDQSRSPRSLMVQPLATPQRVVGAMTISRQRVDPFTELDVAILKVITNQAAIALDNGRLYEQLQAHLDELEMANAQIAEVSRLKSEFLANMSHELRTPLNAILGFSELLRDDLAGKITEKQRKDCLDNIHNSGRHLLSLINDVLDLTKIEAGRMDLVYEEFGVESATREVLNVLRSLAIKKDIEIASTVEPSTALLIADKNKFKQVLYNLLSNAIKFTPPSGQVAVQARAEHRCSGQWYRDRPGTAEQDLRRLLPGAECQQPGVPGHRTGAGAHQEAGRIARRIDRLREHPWPGDHLHRPAAAPAGSEQAQPGIGGRGQPVQPGSGPDGPGGKRLHRRHRVERPGGAGEGSPSSAGPNTDGYAASRR